MLSLPVIASAQSNSNSVDAQPDANLSASTAPLTLTLQDAIARARKNNPEYRAALAQYGSAKEDRVQGRAALLPGVNYNAGFLYTQGNGTPTGRFVGANGVHEYISQGNVHQDISLQGIADYRRSGPGRHRGAGLLSLCSFATEVRHGAARRHRRPAFSRHQPEA